VGPDETEFSTVDALLWGVDLSYVDVIEPLQGSISLLVEWVWSDTDSVDFGEGEFDNERAGGYQQLAYRPTSLGKILNDFEVVTRYDIIDMPAGASGEDDERLTVGLNYWLGAATVVKSAYQIATLGSADEESGKDTLFFQIFAGF
jgi:hypothetical protein